MITSDLTGVSVSFPLLVGSYVSPASNTLATTTFTDIPALVLSQQDVGNILKGSSASLSIITTDGYEFKIGISQILTPDVYERLTAAYTTHIPREVEGIPSPKERIFYVPVQALGPKSALIGTMSLRMRF